MEYAKRVGRTTFRAEITHNERGDWSIRAGVFRATLSLTWPEPDAWIAAGKPTDPTEIPERIEAFLAKVAAGKPKGSPAPKKIKYERSSFVPLDGEESVRVVAVEKRSISYNKPSEIVTGRVFCTSPRCRGREWLVVQLPGSQYDRATGGERVESIAPEEFAEQHRTWHRETFPASQRAELDRWIDRHKNVQIPEPSEAERLEIDFGIALAKSEH